MQNAKNIKEILQETIEDLKVQKEYIQNIINDMEARIKINKKAGNISELDNLSPTEKNVVQTLIKKHIPNTEESTSLLPFTTAKKLMPKMKEKV